MRMPEYDVNSEKEWSISRGTESSETGKICCMFTCICFCVYLQSHYRTWAPTQSQEERLNAFHRKQLKKVLNIKYPVKITNSSLYNKCNERPLSIFILESRWRLFGHILRRDSQIPANQAMSRYFVTEGSKFKGRPLTTLPVVLNRDLSLIIKSNLQLKSSHDLEHLRSIVQQRDEWTKLTARIREAAEASESEH
ncbi:hypothetical protein ElyMa_006203400 [Elysia marginata]|uniref:Uncharacterized protein n=1 Tax=Elysia marginata TaxID=1093978 RepID=A0AAV4H4A2_9GAST|nr:hypothetical protein ElyMa_006203400 [Elysia marginata]